MAVVASKKKTTANATDNTNTSTNKTNTGTGTFTTSAGNTYNTFTGDNFVDNPYQKSDTVNQAWDTVTQKQANAPSAWTDPYKDKYMGYLNQYENRDPFNYDFNSDALYQQYKDQYIQQGQMAMMDTMGQAAAMTGGYGNSYAQTVGQQAYNQQLNQLNEIMPELYDRAYNVYQQKGQDMLNMYNAYLGLSQNDYNQYLGEVDNYYKDLDASYNYYNTLYGNEFNEHQANENMRFNVWNANTGIAQDNWATQLGIESSENEVVMDQTWKSSEYQLDRDDDNKTNAYNNLSSLITSTGHKPTADELEAAGMTEEQAASYLNEYNESSESDKKTNLISLIKYSGYEPTAEELKAAGMTAEEAAGWKSGYDASQKTTTTSTSTSTSSSTSSTKTTTMSKADRDSWKKDLAECTTEAQVVAVGKEMEGMGYSSDIVDALCNNRLEEILADDGGGSGGGSGGGLSNKIVNAISSWLN